MGRRIPVPFTKLPQPRPQRGNFRSFSSARTTTICYPRANRRRHRREKPGGRIGPARTVSHRSSSTLERRRCVKLFDRRQAAYARARNGDGPSIIEAQTYRMTGHSCGDPSTYQPKAEREEWRGRDPIDLYRKRLVDSGVSPDLLGWIESEARAAVERATAEAKAAPKPSLESARRRTCGADGGSAWRN